MKSSDRIISKLPINHTGFMGTTGRENKTIRKQVMHQSVI